MAGRFINVDRSTGFLLPPDLRDWVPEDDMVHFVIEAIEGMSLPSLHVNRRGSGSAQYPPRMMLGLLIYCYANGIFSSRRIERATYRDVGVRYLTGDTHPDHDTICKFRRENFTAISEAFLEVLQLARTLGLLKVGTISIDGTKLLANASKHKNVRYDRLLELDQKLEADIAALLERAEQADDEDDNDGQSLPEQISRREQLQAKLQQARARLELEAKEKASAEMPDYEARLQKYQQRRRGLPPQPPSAVPEAKKQINLTDHDSRLMRKNRRSSYEQCYNSQASVDADGSQLIVAHHVTNSARDTNELLKGSAVNPSLGHAHTVLADSGYVKVSAIETLENQGVDVYVSVGCEDDHHERRYEYRPSEQKPKRQINNPCLLAMREKLKTEAGRRMYARRKVTVEPVFGVIKQAMGFRQYLLRGLEKVSGEWSLVCLAYNFKRLWGLVGA